MAGLISLILLWESAEKYSALPVSDIRIDANKQKMNCSLEWQKH